MELELRYAAVAPTLLRKDSEDDDEEDRGRLVSGYAAVFNSPTTITDRDGRSFTEIIRPGAFGAALKSSADVRALLNHNPDNLLGRTKADTLRLFEDTRGLHFQLTLPRTALGQQVAESIRRGDLDGASFGFTPMEKGERWGVQDGKPVRELLGLNIFDVSLATYPAYQRTEVQVRSAFDLSQLKRRLRLLELETH